MAVDLEHPTVRVEGEAGAIACGYQVGAWLRRWRLELLPVLPRRYRLSATFAVASAYWLSQEPLDIVVRVGDSAWKWRLTTTPGPVDGLFVTIVSGQPSVSDARVGILGGQAWAASGR